MTLTVSGFLFLGFRFPPLPFFRPFGQPVEKCKISSVDNGVLILFCLALSAWEGPKRDSSTVELRQTLDFEALEEVLDAIDVMVINLSVAIRDFV